MLVKIVIISASWARKAIRFYFDSPNFEEIFKIVLSHIVLYMGHIGQNRRAY